MSAILLSRLEHEMNTQQFVQQTARTMTSRACDKSDFDLITRPQSCGVNSCPCGNEPRGRSLGMSWDHAGLSICLDFEAQTSHDPYYHALDTHIHLMSRMTISVQSQSGGT